MNAFDLIKNNDFVVMAMADAFELLSDKTGISITALQEQFPTNKELQTRVAEMITTAAKITAKELG